MSSTNEDIGNRLAQLRGDRDSGDFARDLSLDEQGLAGMEHGDITVPVEVLASLGEQGYNAYWVLSGEGDVRLVPGSEQAHANMIRAVLGNNRTATDEYSAQVLIGAQRSGQVQRRIEDIVDSVQIELPREQRELLVAQLHELFRDIDAERMPGRSV